VLTTIVVEALTDQLDGVGARTEPHVGGHLLLPGVETGMIVAVVVAGIEIVIDWGGTEMSMIEEILGVNREKGNLD
jgi:hypothetical protein